MTTPPSGLPRDQLGTIGFSTGLSFSGTLNSINGWDWSGDNPATYTGGASAHKWGGGLAGTAGGTVSYYFDPGSGFSQSVANIYVSALTLWSDLANIDFVSTTDPTKAQLSFYLFNTTTPNVPLDNGAYATAVYQGGKPGDAIVPATQAVTVSIEQSGQWAHLDSFTYDGGEGPATIMHELGHAVGLMHTGPYNSNVASDQQQYNTTDMYLWSLMSYIPPSDNKAKYYDQYPIAGTNYNTQTTPVTPQVLDILGVQQLYGMPTSTTFAGGQVFGFNSNIADDAGIFYDFTKNTDPVVTIWDYGTNNTLDLSGFFTPSTVNLNPGTFSSVDGMTNNIGIAYSTAIDRAIGGAGSDSFLVNSDSDTIDGGGGSNTVRFSHTHAAYVVTSLGNGSYTVGNGAATDTLRNIQTLQFADQSVAVSSLPGGDTLKWNTGNGTFSDKASWTDATKGGPAAAPPNATNIALVPGPTSGGPQVISGDGTAAQLVFTGLSGITGDLTTALLTVGQGGDHPAIVTIAPGAAIAADSAAVDNGTLKVNGSLTTANTMALAPSDAVATAVLEMRLGGSAQIGTLVLNGGTVSVDGSSSLEVGTAGAAAAGGVTVDAGHSVSGNGTLPSVTDNGTITASGGMLSIASLDGKTGSVQIAADGTLKLAGATTVPITFAAATGTLAVTAPSDEIATFGSVTGFAAGDAISVNALNDKGKAQPLLQPTYAADTGLLTVATAQDIGVSATLAGDFSGNVFLLMPAGTGVYNVVTAPGTLNGSKNASDGTQDGHTFGWSAAGSGDWNTAGNWKDVSDAPEAVAPGSNDTAFVQGAILPNQVQVISGNADAKSLTFAGANAYSGTLDVGQTLSVGQIGNPATLALIGRAAIKAGSAAVFGGPGGALDIASGTRLTVTNALTISSGPSQNIAPLEVYGGGSVQAGSLVLTGTLAPIALDSASKLEIGTVGGAQAGILTVDAGKLVSGTGDLSTIGITDNGSIVANGGVLSVGAVSGTGSLSVAGNATLSLAVSENNPITFAGPGGSLLVRNTDVTLGTVTGFAQGETIAVSALPQSLPTKVTYTPTGEDVGTLSLTNDFGTKVTLTLDGDYTGAQFVLGAGSSPGVATVTIACFAAGTRIATPDGEVAVELLRPGDLVCTHLASSPQSITWIGHRHIDCRRHPAPHQVLPVRMRAGCLGPDLPNRDLLLSPDHAVFVDGNLIPVKHLINGAAIAQIEVDQVDYYHLELPRHDVVLAEGLPAESYLDTGDRANFANGGSVVKAYPDFVSRTWEAEGCARLVVTGPELDAVRRRVEQRSRGKRRAGRHKVA